MNTKRAWKGFEKGLICKGFQYKEGETYEIKNNVVLCERGFHACEFPLDVLTFYSPIDSEYAEVEQFGEIKSDDIKTVSSGLRVKAKITIAGLIEAAVEWISDRAKSETKAGDSSTSASAGDSSTTEALGKNCIAMIAGTGGSIRVGENGCFALAYYDEKQNRNRILAAHVGEDGVEPNKWYKIVDGKLVEDANKNISA